MHPLSNQSYDTICQSVAQHGRESRKVRAYRRRLAGKPPERDLKIFKALMIEHRRHEEAARLFGLSRGRISQIVKRMSVELAEAAPDDPEIKNFLARQRLEKRLDKMRLEYVLEETARALREEPRHLESRRQGTRQRGDKAENWEEITTREQRLNVQLLKTYLRTAESIRKLRAELLEGEPQVKLTDLELFEAICFIFQEWIARVWQDPNPPSEEFRGLIRAFHDQLFSFVLARQKGTPPAEAWPSDDRERLFAARILGREQASANLANQNAPEINPPSGCVLPGAAAASAVAATTCG